MQCKYSFILTCQRTLNSCFCWLWMQKGISCMAQTARHRLTQKRVGLLPLWTSTDPDTVTWCITGKSDAADEYNMKRWRDLTKSKSSCWSFRHTDLYDNDEEESHISGKVDFVNLEHRRAQTKDQNPDNNLDCLRVARKSHQHIMQYIWNFLMRKNALDMSPNIALKIPMSYV